MTWEFLISLKSLKEFSDDLADALYDAGCDDGTLVSRDGHSFIFFARDANSLNEAIRSAINDIRSVGLEVERVQIEESSLTTSEIALW